MTHDIRIVTCMTHDIRIVTCMTHDIRIVKPATKRPYLFLTCHKKTVTYF